MLFIFLIFSFTLLKSADYLSSIDSLRNELKISNPKSMKYHKANIELFRLYRFNNRDSAKIIIDKGYNLSNQYGLDTAKRDYYNIKGLYYFDDGDFSKALENYYKCMQLSVDFKDYGAVGFSFNDIGYVFYVQGLWDLALEHYKEGLEGMKILDSSKSSPIPYLFQNIGLCYSHLGKIDSAKKYFDKTIEFAKLNKDSNRIYHTYLYIANVYSRNNIDKMKANSIYKEALNYFSNERSWTEGYPFTLYYIAIYYQEMNKLDSAEKYFNLANKELLNIGWEKKTIDINYAFAYLYLFNDKLDKADSLIRYNDLLIKKFMSNDLKSDQYYYKYLFFEKKNRFDSAFYYIKLYNIMKDSILQSSVTGKVSTVSKDLQILKNTQEKKLIEEKNIQKTYLIVFILIVAVFLFLLVYLRMRFQRKNMEILNEKNEELNKTNKLLDEANKTKDKFFSIIAHDLKNPIGAIKGTTEMLDQNYEIFEENEKKEVISQIYKASNSVQSLLDSLLTWSRSQRGIIEFELNTINLKWLFESNQNLLNESAKKKNISIKLDLDDNLEVNADVNMINTIVRNLVSNAIKFTPENGEIKLKANKDNEKTIIEISDNGVGMSKENMAKLFKFSTTFSTDGTNSEKGTGLGLILVKEFVDKHKGTINVESEIGKGTKFIIELPNE